MDARSAVLQLPELLGVILQHLGAEELIWRLPLVCRMWRDFIRDSFRCRGPLRLSGKPRVLKVLTARMPLVRSVDLSVVTDVGFECLQKLKCLEELGLRASLLSPLAFRAMRRFSNLRRLSLSAVTPEHLLHMTQGPAATFTRLKRLELRMCATASLEPSVPAAVLRLAGSAPALSELYLHNSPLSPDNYLLLFLMCPLISTLYVGAWNFKSCPECLLSIGSCGKHLRRVVYTVKPVYDALDGPAEVERIRTAYVQNVQQLFDNCPQLEQVLLRHVQVELQLMAADAHLKDPMGCLMATTSHNVFWHRVRAP